MKSIRTFFANFLKIDPRLMRKMRKLLAPFRRIGLKKEFTLISNNCWGGRLYDKFSKPYLSPTIGLSMCENDFLKFVNNLDDYLKLELIPIKEEQSKTNNEHGNYGCMLGDVKVSFIHYRNVEDAVCKWNRRKKRIAWNNILVKFSYYQDDINESIIKEYARVPYKKILLTNKKELCFRDDLGKVVYIPTDDKGTNEFVLSDKAIKLKEIKKIINAERRQ